MTPPRLRAEPALPNTRPTLQVEEDDYLLKKKGLGVREELAVRNRRYSKLVLDEGMERIVTELRNSKDARRRKESEGSRGYSTGRERKVAEASRRKKDAKKKANKKRREAKAAGKSS